MNRRNFIRNGTLVSAAATIVPDTLESYTFSSAQKKTSFRAVFMSDIHVKPDEISQAGMRKAIRHINNLKQKPVFIINGGDSIMDALAADKNKTQAQWDVWNTILQSENKLPIYHCTGNHDVWGWQVKDDNIKSDPLYDKNWAINQHQMPGRYYSFTHDGWHFIVLDSTQENGGGYIAKLDEEQFNWLEKELASIPTNRHVCVVSHIPIISFCSAMFFEDMLPNGDWKLSRALLHTDARRIKNLFKKHTNIKACLSGHIHLQDHVNYLGIQYFCNGAISGKWWGGAFQDFEPAYAVFDFHKDGTIARQMIRYD
jgi:3',5'-cyclic-AMP phosphodiesterase